MKNYFRFICISVAFAMLFNLQCFASGTENISELLKADWSADYTNANDVVLTVEAESSAGYIQTIAVVMYDDDFDALSDDNKPAITDYYCMDEVVVKKGETGTVTFDITDTATPLADGAYKILVQGSGIDAAKCRLQMPVWVINPSRIPGLISRFNSADTTNLMGCVDEVKNPLRLEVGANESTNRKKAFISIREKDYEGKFTTLHDVERAWILSEVIDCLSDSTPDREKLRNLIEENAESLGVDTENTDYTSNADDVYSTMVYNNSIDKASSAQELKTLFDRAVAIEAVNSASGTNVASKLEKYYEDLGISEEDYEKFDSCKDSQTKLKISRMLASKDFKTTDEINDTFKDAIDKYIKDDDTSSDNGSSGGGGGGGGGGKGGSAIKGMGAPVNAGVSDTTSSQEMQTAFDDCTPSHWAYSYIDELRKNNIVSGYTDGNFYPDRPVKREEFVKMIVSLAGLYNKDSKCTFADVPTGEWYYTYVASAYEKGIVNGVSDISFGVGADVSRQDVAVIVYRLLEKLGADISSAADVKTFTDSAYIADYASDSVSALTKLSVLGGYEDGSFRPTDSITRAEAAKIIGMVKTFIK